MHKEDYKEIYTKDHNGGEYCWLDDEMLKDGEKLEILWDDGKTEKVSVTAFIAANSSEAFADIFYHKTNLLIPLLRLKAKRI